MTSRQTSDLNVCIVGAGIVGLITAYYLAKSKQCTSVTLIEEAEVAGGASGKAAGFLARDWHGPPTSSLGKLSFRLHEELAKELDGVQKYGFRYVPSLSASISEGNGSKAARRTIERHEKELGWMNADNIVDIDYIEDEAGTAQVHPKLFCETIWRECQRLGVRILHTRPQKMEQRGEADPSRILVCANGERIETNKLVITAGPWTARVVKELTGTGIDIKELAGHSFVITTTEALPPLAGFATARDKAGRATTSPEWFTRPDGTIYVAGENSGAPLPPGAADVQMDDSSLERLAAVCRLISPQLDITDANAVQHVHKQLCYRPVSRRGYPYLSALPNDADIFVGAGHGPWGISLGPGSGLVMSELVLNGKASSANISYLGI